jgi:hypothetical protein
VRPPLSEALRLHWGLLLPALAASPLLALVLLTIVVVFLHHFRRKEFGRPSVTLRGELVRSRSEKAIADWFSRNGVRYVYEYPAFDLRGSVIGRPDFYLPDYGVYVEYWGLAGLPDGSVRSRYERIMQWKMEQYRRNGIRFVSLYPGDLDNLSARFGPKPERTVFSQVLGHGWFTGAD